MTATPTPTPTTTALLELEGITKEYSTPSGEPLRILTDLDFAIEPGEVVSIVGRSGQGKSTFLNILGLLDQPTSGRFLCDGRDVASLGDAQTSRLRGEVFGFIFQQFYLSDRRSALENVAEPFLYGRADEISERLQVAEQLLEKVGLSHRLHARPNQLSGGEQQRVAIARALARRPRIVLADEPTGSLDAGTGDQVIDLLFDLVRTESLTLILVSHDETVASRADRMLVLRDGKLHPGGAS